ncbi:MAG: hypothetical protein UY50_C0008G0029 [Parcubacteria group bacterium GW2011_GWA2_49_9]|nr:MAG: hypothetical protein UY50_C0008G0029 [Parcubacteria group bacterium GW2011_GWA2_49_9]
MNGYLHARNSEDSVSLSVCSGNEEFIFLGASCSASVQPAFASLKSITIAPRKNKEEVVALAVVAHAQERRGSVSRANFLVRVSFSGERPWVEPDKFFIPRAGRLGEITGEWSQAMLSVRIEEKTFVYSPLDLLGKDHAALTNKGFHVVCDGNVLCRYMTGDAQPDEVEKAVVARPNEQTVFEQLAEALERAKRGGDRSNELSVKLLQLEHLHETLRGKLMLEQDRCASLKREATQFIAGARSIVSGDYECRRYPRVF